MRLFIALELPEEAIAALTEVQSACKSQWPGRYVKPEQMHITVKFMGEVQADCRDRAITAMREAAALPAIELCAKECGLFGNRQTPGIWVAMAGNVREMAALAKLVDERICALCGVPMETRQFRPHVTLGRNVQIRQGEALPQISRRPFTADRLTLFSSELRPEGPIYKRIHTEILRGKAGDAK